MGAIASLYYEDLKDEAWKTYMGNSMWAVLKSISGGKYNGKMYSELMSEDRQKKVNDHRSADDIKSGLLASLGEEDEG